MDNTNDRKKEIFAALKKRIKESTEKEIVNEIGQLIGDRRVDDVQDILVTIEQSSGWESALQNLRKSQDVLYNYPIGLSDSKRKVEPIKFREVIFDILGYRGFDATNLSTNTLLEFLETKSSFTESCNTFYDYILPIFQNQISKSDTLFFEIEKIDSILPVSILSQIEAIRKNELDGIITHSDEDLIPIENLWFTEYGFQALSKLGISKSNLSEEEYNIVLSVIPVIDSIKNNISTKKSINQEFEKPSNPIYRELLRAFMTNDIDSLRSLGRRHASLYFESILNKTIDDYTANEKTENFRSFIESLDNLISIRDVESINSLYSIISKDEPRLATPSISSLGNFYHPSSVEILIEMICNKRNKVIAQVSSTALRNILNKCPHFEYILKRYIDSDCTYQARIKQLYLELAKRSKSEMYYD